MATKKIQTLCKEYECELIEDYFRMIYESHCKGNFKQAKEQFKLLQMKERKAFILWAVINLTKIESSMVLQDML